MFFRPSGRKKSSVNRFSLVLVLICLVFFIPGCSTARRGSGDTLPAGTAAGVSGFSILPHDTMEVLVYDNPDLSMRVQVSPSGMISFPLVGSIRVEGLTAPESEELLEEKLSEYIVNPRVNVTVPQIAERVVIYVSGQVMRPGSYRLKLGMTVYQAITVAGGLTDIAAPNNTRVVRSGEDGQEVIPVRIAAMLRSGDMSGDIRLMPGDTVIVPESFF